MLIAYASEPNKNASALSFVSDGGSVRVTVMLRVPSEKPLPPSFSFSVIIRDDEGVDAVHGRCQGSDVSPKYAAAAAQFRSA